MKLRARRSSAGKIVGKRIFRAGYAGARDEIEKPGGRGGDFLQALVGGSGRGEKNGVEIVRVQDAAIVLGFFGREIGDEDAVGSGLRGSRGKFLQSHLQDGIEVAEEDKRDLAGFADAANQIENAASVAPALQGAFGGTLNRGAIGERIAEGHAKFDDVGAGFGERQDKFERGIERGIARGDIGDDAEFAAGAEFREAFGDASRVVRKATHWIWPD